MDIYHGYLPNYKMPLVPLTKASLDCLKNFIAILLKDLHGLRSNSFKRYDI